MEVRKQVPVQYQSRTDFSPEKSYQTASDLMGLGKRFAYKIDKQDESTPGPGMYTDVAANSI